MKKLFVIVLVLCALLAGCDHQMPERSPILTDDAVQIVLDDLDMSIEEANPHVHEGNYQGTACYYVYVTVDGENMAYAIDMYLGDILNIVKSNHSH